MPKHGAIPAEHFMTSLAHLAASQRFLAERTAEIAADFKMDPTSRLTDAEKTLVTTHGVLVEALGRLIPFATLAVLVPSDDTKGA